MPVQSPHLLTHWRQAVSITSIGILGIPKIEIERKPQGNFQADFIKLIDKHKGGSTEERTVL